MPCRPSSTATSRGARPARVNANVGTRSSTLAGSTMPRSVSPGTSRRAASASSARTRSVARMVSMAALSASAARGAVQTAELAPEPLQVSECTQQSCERFSRRRPRLPVARSVVSRGSDLVRRQPFQKLAPAVEQSQDAGRRTCTASRPGSPCPQRRRRSLRAARRGRRPRMSTPRLHGPSRRSCRSG